MIKGNTRQLPNRPQAQQTRVLPTLKGLKPPTEKTKALPVGKYLVEVEKIKDVYPRKGGMGIVPEFYVREIQNQEAYTNPETGMSNETKIGERRCQWFEIGGEYGYGEAEWAAFLKALGSTDETIDADQETALSPENPLKGATLWIIRKLELAENGNKFIKTFFEPADEAA